MNEKELAEIEARIDPLYRGEMNGEWVEDTDENGDEWIRIPGGHDVKFWNIEGSSGCCYDVIHFIVHARQDVPALVAEVRRSHNEYRLFRHDAGAEIERLRASLKYYNELLSDFERLRAALEASEKVCKIISEYMSSGEFFDPETSKAIYEWQALKGGAQ